jgi:hypothetical protein
MTRNLSILARILAVALALSGVAAATASAQQGLLTSDGPVTLTTEETEKGGPLTLTATQTGAESANALTVFGSKVRCGSAVYTGHKYNVTPHTFIPTNATQVTITPHYGKCTLFGKPATVDMNGCDYVLDFEGTTGTDKFGVKTTIVCPSEKHIQVTMFESEAKHTEAKSFCMLTLTENAAGYAGLSATDTTNGRIDVTGAIKEMTVHEKSAAAECAETTTTSGELHLDVEVEGKNESGIVKAISISDEGKLIWDETPAGSNATTMFGAKTECPGSTFTGHKYNETPHRFIPNGATTITLTPHYKNCAVSGIPITVDMNGCDYVLHIGQTTGAAGTYGVTTDIVCPVGQEIRMTLFGGATKHAESKPFCKIDIKEQAGLKGLHATNTETGYFDLSGTLEGLHMLRTNIEFPILCPNNTTTTEAKYDFDLTVKGLNEAGASTPIALSD